MGTKSLAHQRLLLFFPVLNAILPDISQTSLATTTILSNNNAQWAEERKWNEILSIYQTRSIWNFVQERRSVFYGNL